MRWVWRKKAEGFEWKDYVRTTILVRRNERRQKVEDAKQAAIFGVKQAGRKGADAGAAGVEAVGRAGEAVGRAGKAAGAAIGRGGLAAGAAVGRGGLAAGAAIGRGAAAAGVAAGRGAAAAGVAFGRSAAAAARASGKGLAAGGSAMGRASRAGYGKVRNAARPHVLRAGQGVFDLLEPALNALLRPSLAMPLTIVAIVAAVGAIIRAINFGVDGEVMFAAVVALVAAMLTLIPRALAGTLPRPLNAVTAVLGGGLRRASGAASRSPKLAGGLAAGAVVAAGAWLLWPPGFVPSFNTASVDHRKPDAAPSVAVTRVPELNGRASVVSGDSLKVGGTTVKLAGIEAPEGNQKCPGPEPESSWRCGQGARDALAKSVRGQQVSCRLAGEDDSGRRLATCQAGDKDIAAELVRGGHVFAVPGFFARYGSVEGEARSARTGVWQADEVERPSEFRAKRWEEAKRNSPDGCPIKGRVSSGSRTYVLPWSSNYESVRVRERRGERWFCSEQEARSAGWRPTTL